MFQKTLTNDSAHAIGELMFHAAYNVQPHPGIGATDWRAYRALASVIRTTICAYDHMRPADSRLASLLYGAAMAAGQCVDLTSKRGQSMAWAQGGLQRIEWDKLNEKARRARIIVFDGLEQHEGKQAFYMHLDPALCEDVGVMKLVSMTPLKLKADLEDRYPTAAILYR